MTNVIPFPHKPQNVQHRLLQALENLGALNRSTQTPTVVAELPSPFVSIGEPFVSIGELSLRVLQQLESRQAGGAI
jgi:hypothetical protein